MIRSTSDAELALRQAVDAGKRVSVRSGGHCFADLVCNPEVQVLLDLSGMNRVGYDPRLRAFAIEPGARLLNAYEGLYNGWGVTIPGGMCWSVGAGGHVSGGGYGLLSRAHGLVVDHLYGPVAERVTGVAEGLGPVRETGERPRLGGRAGEQAVAGRGAEVGRLRPRRRKCTRATTWKDGRPEESRNVAARCGAPKRRRRDLRMRGVGDTHRMSPG